MEKYNIHMQHIKAASKAAIQYVMMIVILILVYIIFLPLDIRMLRRF